jgi:ketosteroid isomerase-like protein
LPDSGAAAERACVAGLSVMAMSRVLIQRMFEAIDRREFDRLSLFYTPDIVYARPGYERICGFEALVDFYKRVRVAGTGVHELANIVSNGDAAACWGHFAGRSHEGVRLDEHFADVYELSEGRISYRKTHFYRAAI